MHTNLDKSSNTTSTPSLRRPPAQQVSHLDPDRHHVYRKLVGMLIWAAQVHPDLQYTAKDHTRHLASPTEWDCQHLKHTLRYLKGTMRYKFLISPQLPQGQGHSLPLRQLIPLPINTCSCDSDWAADIESRKSTSGRVHSVLQVPLAFNNGTQRSVATSIAEAKPYAIGHGISDSLHIYQLLQELQHHLQRPTFDFGNLDTQYNFTTSTATTKPLSIVDIAGSHLHRQYISIESQQGSLDSTSA